MGHLSWSGTARNRHTGAELPLEFVNQPPVIPAACATLPDQTTCTAPGGVVLFTPEFTAATPAGAGVEVVLDRRGCVVRTSATRGTTLTASQTSLQATGQDTVALLTVAAKGCLRNDLEVSTENGDKASLHKGLYGVTG